MPTVEGSGNLIEQLENTYDAIVIGAGPSGTTCALALAKKNKTVLLVEAAPKANQRLAGEWLHPPAVRALQSLGVPPIAAAAEHAPGRGFVVYPDDGGEPILLPYPNGSVALSCDHSDFVDELRAFAVKHPLITYAPGFRATQIESGSVTLVGPDRSTPRTIETPLCVGADGRSSVTRRALGLPGAHPPLSYMAGLTIRVEELPFEGFGHVILGGPGPVTIYRISKERVRVCLDLPADQADRRDPEFLWRAFHPVLPVALREPFRESLAHTKLSWAATRFCPRTHYGRDGIALAGDAVGYFHPLTAVGMTLGIGDAIDLAESDSVESYQRRREKKSYVAELLSSALYHVFQRDDSGAESIRLAVYKMWGDSVRDRERTMRILTGDDHRSLSFAMTFLKVAAGAVSYLGQRRGGLLTTLARWDELQRIFANYGGWLQWPAASLMPPVFRERFRSQSRSDRPLPQFPLQLPVASSPASVSTKGQPTQVFEESLATARRTVLLHAEASLHSTTVESWDEARRVLAAALALDSAGLGSDRVARALDEASVWMKEQLSADSTPDDPGLATRCLLLRSARDLAVGADWELRVWSDTLRRLLDAQDESGAFGTGASRFDAESTARAVRALRAASERWPGLLTDEISQSLERAAHWLRARQRDSGCWAIGDLPSTMVTGAAVEALMAARTQPSDSAIRRAIRWLCATQADDGTWCLAGEEPTGTTAAALRALRLGSAPQWTAISRGATALAALIANEGALGLETIERVAEAADRALDQKTLRTTRTAATDADWTRCQEALVAVSRTFSRPIEMLPGDLRVSVTCGYLLCRIADTVEDLATLSLPERDALFAALDSVLEDRQPATHFSALFATVDHDPEHPESRLIADFDSVMRVFGTLDPSKQSICRRWVREMLRGMQIYKHREPREDGLQGPLTQRDLERYCYFVAGTVGHLLTELFLEHIDEAPVTLRGALWRNAESFGVALQLVNILKDITDDDGRGVAYVPWLNRLESGLNGHSLSNPDFRPNAHAAVAPLFARAQSLIEDAFEYVMAIPSQQREIRLFCLLPLWMAARTLIVARGNDAQFIPGAPVKISRGEVEKIIASSVVLCEDDDGLREAFAHLRAEMRARKMSEQRPEQRAEA